MSLQQQIMKTTEALSTLPTVLADVSSGTQVWSYYYASLLTVSNATTLLKVSDRRRAPLPGLIMFNYSQPEPPDAA